MKTIWGLFPFDWAFDENFMKYTNIVGHVSGEKEQERKLKLIVVCVINFVVFSLSPKQLFA